MLVARSGPELENVARELSSAHRIRAWPIPTDLSLPGASATLVDRLERESLTIDFLVNNAGLGASGPFAVSDPRRIDEMLYVNMVAPTQLTRAILPGMLERRRGRILNVASTAAFQPGPFMAVYYATKAYVLSFSEALASEVGGSGVTVTTLCPGPTRTGFGVEAGNQASRLMRGAMPVMESAVVARAGYRAMMRGQSLVIPGLVNRIQVLAVRLPPRRVVTGISRWLNVRT